MSKDAARPCIKTLYQSHTAEMSSFMEDLWNSIFTPGPTPPLLLATNATFATLQLLLLVLLIVTYSVHFIVLSILSGGLWYAINWFAREVQAAQAHEETKRRGKRPDDGQSEEEPRAVDTDRASSGYEVDTSSEDTETESDGRKSAAGSRPSIREETPTVGSSDTGLSNEKRDLPAEDTAKLTTGSGVRPFAAGKGQDDPLRKRRSMAESTGSLSTDSEWEKVGDDS